jgi:hypothetical protein
VNPIDYKIRRGAVPGITPDMLPLTLGRDLSGTMAGIGPGTNALRQGDAVNALIGGGSYADYVDQNRGCRPIPADPTAPTADPCNNSTLGPVSDRDSGRVTIHTRNSDRRPTPKLAAVPLAAHMEAGSIWLNKVRFGSAEIAAHGVSRK